MHASFPQIQGIRPRVARVPLVTTRIRIMSFPPAYRSTRTRTMDRSDARTDRRLNNSEDDDKDHHTPDVGIGEGPPLII